MFEKQAYCKNSSRKTCFTESGMGLALDGERGNLGFNLASSITDWAESRNIFELWFLTFFLPLKKPI